MAKVEVQITDEEKARQERFESRPSLDQILNLHDFEVSSTSVFFHPNGMLLLCAGYSKTSHAREGLGILFVGCRWRNHHQGKPRCISQVLTWISLYREPFSTITRIWFRPRILRDVTKVDWSTKILGIKTSMPIYIVRSIQIFVLYDPLTSVHRVQRLSES